MSDAVLDGMPVQDVLDEYWTSSKNYIEKKEEKGILQMNEMHLKELAEVDIRRVRKESLIDIKDVNIDPLLEQADRIRSFIKQIKNPYCFICDGVIVKMNYAEKEDTLEDKLNRYFLSL